MEKWLLPIAIVLAAVIVAAPLSAQNSPEYTGNKFHESPESMRVAYVLGYASGIVASATSGTLVTSWLADCLRTKPGGQLATIIDKHMTNNPQEWDQAMAAIALRAFTSACLTLPK